jgi:hypothetical protein
LYLWAGKAQPARFKRTDGTEKGHETTDFSKTDSEIGGILGPTGLHLATAV